MRLSEIKEKIIKIYGKRSWEKIEESYEYKVYTGTEKEQISALIRDVYAIKYIKNPTKKVKLEAVKHNPFVIKYINNPSEKLKLLAVKQDGYVIEHIDNPSEKVQLEAVKKNVYSIACIHNPTDKVIQKAIKEFYNDDTCNLKYILRFIKNDLNEKDSKEDEV